ncbi:MAG: hypothetical protein GY930_10690 [bacterium]|nr:hypothetical protein [bacterium]
MLNRFLRLSLLLSTAPFGAVSLEAALPQVPELLTPSRIQTVGGQAIFCDASDDGRFVLFVSDHANMISGQIDEELPESYNLFVRDRMNGTTALVTHTGDGVTAGVGFQGSNLAKISDDGSTVAFASSKADLVAGFDGQGVSQLFMYDVATGVVSVVTTDASNAALGGNSSPNSLAVDADGSTIIYESQATNLISGFVNANGTGSDVFAYDVSSGTTTLVSHSTAGTTTGGNGDSGKGFSKTVHVSDSGTTVTFVSRASDLISSFSSSSTLVMNVYSYDLGTGTTTLMTHDASSATVGADYYVGEVDVSADGQRVAYITRATNLVTGFVDGTSGAPDIFVYDLASDTTSLVNHTSGSPVTSLGQLYEFALSADSNLIFFWSRGADHVAGVTDTNGLLDLYVYAVAAGTLSLVSHLPSDSMTAAGVLDNEYPDNLACSSDGGMISFIASAPSLVAGYVPGSAFRLQAFLYDLASGTFTLVSHAYGFPTTGANNLVTPEGISEDGSTVFVDCAASNLTTSVLAGDGALLAIDSGTTTSSVVSILLGTMSSTSNSRTYLNPEPDLFNSDSVISDDGRYVLFSGDSSDLIPGLLHQFPDHQSNLGGHLFLVDRTADTLTLVSDIGDGTTTSVLYPESGYAISGNGEIVAFTSRADDLIAGFTGGGSDNLFVYSVTTDTLVLGSHDFSSVTAGANGSPEWDVTISGDGAWIAYASKATNISAGVTDGNGAADVFLYEVATGFNTLVSHAISSTSTSANGYSGAPEISNDGSTIIFISRATDLIAGFIDNNGSNGVFGNDVYSYDVATGTVTLLSHSTTNPLAGANDGSWDPKVSGAGDVVAFASAATDLVAGFINNNAFDVDLFVSSSGTIALVTHDEGSAVAGGAGFSSGHQIARNGGTVAFLSRAANLVGGFIDNNGFGADIYRYDIEAGTNTLVSHAHNSLTTSGDGASQFPRVNVYGSRIAFESHATDLVAGVVDDDNWADVFLHEVGLDETILISHVPNQPTMAANCSDVGVHMNADGTLLAFESLSTDLVDNDLNSDADLFAYEYPLPPIGTSFCDPNNANSTGVSTTLSGYMLTRGGIGGGMSDLHLECTNGVALKLGYFLVGTVASDPGSAVSDGMMCLGSSGPVYRYNVAGTTANSVGLFNAGGVLVNYAGTSSVGSAGMQTGFDVPDAVAGASQIITAGSTWHFQVWHRDIRPSGATSNFSNGLSVTF